MVIVVCGTLSNALLGHFTTLFLPLVEFLPVVLVQARSVQNILQQLDAGRTDTEQLLAIQQLLETSSDVTFAEEFINKDGHRLIVSMIESGTKLVSSCYMYELLIFLVTGCENECFVFCLQYIGMCYLFLVIFVITL